MTKKHGHTKLVEGKWAATPTYISWKAMRQRVKRSPSYLRKGVAVCERWSSFENFLEDMGERPLGPTRFTIDRIDTGRDYGPDNCRWATNEQQANNSDGNRWLCINGERMTVKQASRTFCVPSPTIISRLNRGVDGVPAVLPGGRGSK
jgi:hypothetical protein